MRPIALAALVLFGSLGGTLAQDYAALGPTGDTAVLNRCGEVVERQIDGDRSLDGECIGAVRARMVGLQATISPGELDAVIADLVPDLVALAQADIECNIVDTEIAEAVRVAQSFTTSPDQAELLLQIAATVEACLTEATAAIPPLASEE